LALCPSFSCSDRCCLSAGPINPLEDCCLVTAATIIRCADVSKGRSAPNRYFGGSTNANANFSGSRIYSLPSAGTGGAWRCMLSVMRWCCVSSDRKGLPSFGSNFTGNTTGATCTAAGAQQLHDHARFGFCLRVANSGTAAPESDCRIESLRLCVCILE